MLEPHLTLDGGVPQVDLCKILHGGLQMSRVRNGVEILQKFQ